MPSPTDRSTMPDHTYTTDLLGRAAVTQYGERGAITGPALDPARCRFQPDAPGTEFFTPRIASLTFDEDTSEEPCTEHGFDVCPGCGNVGIVCGPNGYVPCTRFLTCWTDTSDEEN